MIGHIIGAVLGVFFLVYIVFTFGAMLVSFWSEKKGEKRRDKNHF